MEPRAENVSVRVCRPELVKECGEKGGAGYSQGEGGLCRTEHTSECVTPQQEGGSGEEDRAECSTVTEERCGDEGCAQVPRQVLNWTLVYYALLFWSGVSDCIRPRPRPRPRHTVQQGGCPGVRGGLQAGGGGGTGQEHCPNPHIRGKYNSLV